MDKDIAIQVKNVGKTFRIPHEKVDSLRGAFVGALKGKRTFEEFKALDGVSFDVKKGEFFGIIGRNGSGKSTLLKILAGIYQADKGSVRTNGLISPFLELGIGFNPELSGRDNIYLNATVLGLTKKEIDEKFDSIVAFSELERFIDQKLKNYSSGMQVRLAFSVSIHANRDILLMDEVLAVGDSNFQAKCLEEFIKYKEIGKTVILVTHDIATVQRYCDRAMLLRNGKMVTIGKSEEVGNAYIEQNISDEATRLRGGSVSSMEKETRETREDMITDVLFYDSEGERKDIFKTGDDITVKVCFRSKEQSPKMNFGIAIYSIENEYIFGVNSIIDEIDTSNFSKQGYFQVRYRNVPLKSNTYFIKAGIFGKTDRQIIDFLHKSKTFKVRSSDKSQGLVKLSYEWR